MGLEPPRGYVFEDAFRLWCSLKKGRIVSYRDERRMLERLILPHLRNRQLDEIAAPLIVQIVRPLDTSGRRVTLKRVLMRTREILDLAVCAGYIQHNPIERVSRIFAPPVTKPMPSVDWRELESVMRVMVEAPHRVQVLFAVSLCTMLRPVEVTSLKWEWIDGDTLTIPGEHMKKGRAHRVPLTPEALRLLDEARACSPHPRSRFVFPAIRDGSKALNSQTLAKHLHSSSLRGKLVAHGLRSIARSWMADHSEPFEAAEACLSHVVGSGISRAYQRSDYLDVRRDIMARWSSFVSDCARSAAFLAEVFGATQGEGP